MAMDIVSVTRCQGTCCQGVLKLFTGINVGKFSLTKGYQCNRRKQHILGKCGSSLSRFLARREEFNNEMEFWRCARPNGGGRLHRMASGRGQNVRSSGGRQRANVVKYRMPRHFWLQVV